MSYGLLGTGGHCAGALATYTVLGALQRTAPLQFVCKIQDYLAGFMGTEHTRDWHSLSALAWEHLTPRWHRVKYKMLGTVPPSVVR